MSRESRVTRYGRDVCEVGGVTLTFDLTSLMLLTIATARPRCLRRDISKCLPQFLFWQLSGSKRGR